MTLETGTTIGRYRILGLLGRGGMADVYKAQQVSLDRVVALKVIRVGLTEDPSFAERFAREARAVAKLEHPNIVPVFDFEEVDGRSVLAMQFLDAGTLKERLAESRGPLPPTETVRIVRGIADALDHAHDAGIVHRDVKPSNVMLTAGGRVLVTDFGIAKILGTATTQYTQTAMSVGTPDYMSPEQGQGLPVDRRSDVYALGAVAYEMLTGRVPFAGDTPIAVMLRHIRDPLPRPSELNPAIGPATEAVLAKAMAKVPTERYATAGEFAAALDASLAAAGVAVTPVARSGSPIALIAAGLALLVLVGGGVALAAGVFDRSSTTAPSPTVALPVATPTAPAPTTVTPSVTTFAGAEVTFCTPAAAPAGSDFSCRFTGFQPGTSVSVTTQHSLGALLVPPIPSRLTVVQPDGSWTFNVRTSADAPAGRVTVTATSSGVTKVMQYQIQ